MASQKPSIPKGTRDFPPTVLKKRRFIIERLTHAFELFGFQPIETPSLENLSVLEGKYGEEGDQLLFRVLKQGEKLEKALGKEKIERQDLTEMGLRYDLTVPFARYVSMSRNEIAMPFRRYQIQPVWRGDRPSKGRYREFWQCDADIVGSDSLQNEAELLALYHTGFKSLGLAATIKLNNRKLLAGLAEAAGASGQFVDFCTAIDKLDKIGAEGVVAELEQRGFALGQIKKLEPIFQKKQTNLSDISTMVGSTEVGAEGIKEVEETLGLAGQLMPADTILIDITLARGLTYYTGAIMEVEALGVNIGSIGGGGRYADLTGLFGMAGVSGVGVSFGLDRIADAMEETNVFPDTLSEKPLLLIVAMEEKFRKEAMKMLQEFRSEGIPAELYPDEAKMKKQMAYADKRGFEYVLVIGEEEMASGRFALKYMQEGKQEAYSMEELRNIFKR